MQQTILIVDDSIHNRSAVKRLLDGQGLAFLESENGEEALATAARHGIDLILLDIGMPVMDGYTFLRHFRQQERNQSVPVCVMTAWADSTNRQKTIDLGADDFVAKPIDRVELQTRVKSLLRVRGIQTRLMNFNSQLESMVAERTRALVSALDDLEKSRQETLLAYRETVLRLAMAAEHKDRVTSAHINRMSHYSALLARRAGWPEEDAQLLLEAAKMHDIGKIGIPDSILHKDGQLTVDEFAVMKSHAQIGAAILGNSKSRLLQLAEQVALNHHERFDGSGYPLGLRGKDIPEVGRIVAIADVFDALLTRRPYKEAWPLAQVFALMKENAGSHFDPDLLELFLNEPEDLLDIYRRFPDGPPAGAADAVTASLLAVGS